MKSKISFFNRLLICILCACIIPSIITITVYYNNISKETIDRIGRNNLGSLELVSAYMDDLIYNMTAMAATHKSYIDASLISETHFGDCIINVYRLFRGLSEMPEKIDISFIYSSGMNYAMGIFTRKASPMLRYLNNTNDIYAGLYKKNYTKVTLLKNNSFDNQECLIIATPVMKANYAITGTIFTGKYLQSIRNDISLYLQEYTGNVAIYNRDKDLLAVLNDQDRNFIDEIINITGNSTGCKIINTTRGKYLAVNKTSLNTGFGHLSYISLASILSGFNPFNYYSLYVIMMAAVLAIISGIFALRIIYKPLGNLAKQAQKLDQGNQTKNEIQIIQNALDSLNSSKLSLSAIIRDNQYIIDYKKFCESIFGQTGKEKIYNIEKNAIIAMINIRLSMTEDDNYYATIKSSKIAESAEKYYSGMQIPVKILQTYKNEIIIIFLKVSGIPESITAIKEYLIQLENELKQSFPDILALNIGIGLPIDEPAMITESYFFARKSMEFAKNSGISISDSAIDIKNDENKIDLLSYENRLLKLLAAKKINEIHLLIDEITAEAAKTPTKRIIDKIYDFYARMIFESILSFSQINPKVAQILAEKSYMSDFSRAENLIDKSGWLKSFFTEILSIAANPENNPALLANKIKTACEYIQTHYNRLITLDEAAEIVNLNPSYFSTVFKIQTGQTFTDYINKLRINYAKQLLEGKETISGISGKVGYVSVYQLNRFFRKYEKITAAQYRDNLRLKNNFRSVSSG